MLEVNVPNLKNIVENLNSLINEYEEVKLNLFNQLNDSCVNWQDGNSIEFDNRIYYEKTEADLFFGSLKNKKAVYDFIHDKYSEIGKKIRMNLNARTKVISSLDRCCQQATTVINLFSNVDTGYRYGGEINAQKAKIVAVKKELENLKNEVNNLYTKVEQIETEIRAKIDALEIVKINGFDFVI